MNLLQAVEATHSKRRIVVSYDLMAQDTDKQFSRIQTMFQLTDVDKKEVDAYVDEYIDKELDGSNASIDDLRSEPATKVVASCVELYECLIALAKDDIQFDSDEFTERWQPIVNTYTQLYPMYCYLDRLLKKRSMLKQNLKDMRQSIVWKLLLPLRYVENLVRERRRRSRLRKKTVIQHA